jgi:hypothetical protein|tara:strand:- start:882 stop:1100 length:219 start_codon:yes stop_codon:yes gene_type:complete
VFGEGKMITNQITKNDFLNYEQVRRFGGYDMIDPRSFTLTGLSRARYLCIYENYKSLCEKYANELKREEWIK